MYKFICACALLISGTASASVDAPLKQCANISDNTQRLACFDNYIASKSSPAKQSIAEVPNKKTTQPIVVEPAVAAPHLLSTDVSEPELLNSAKAPEKAEHIVKDNSVPKSIEDNFGLEHKKSQEELDNQRLEFTIAKAKKLPHDKWSLTFTNEQKWTTLSSERMKFKEGQTAIISRGMFNSFSLKLPNSNRSVKVKRVK